MTPRQVDRFDEAAPEIALAPPEQFEREVAAAAARAAGGVPHALLVLALERVVDVRRECGPAAEAALVSIVQRALFDLAGPAALGTWLRPDRLAVLHPRCLPRDALAFARRARIALEGGQFLWQGLSFRLGAYIGVLELRGPDVMPGDQIARALRACEGAVALGGDGIVFGAGDPAEQAALDAENAWREHLREVI